MIKNYEKVPEVVFVVDTVYEKQAVREANTIGAEVFGISNSNANPNLVTDVIPANTNAVTSIEYVTATIKPAFKVWVKPQSKPVIKRQDQTKVSWERKAIVRKPRAEDRKVNIKKVEKTEAKVEPKVEAKKAPAKKEEK